MQGSAFIDGLECREARSEKKRGMRCNTRLEIRLFCLGLGCGRLIKMKMMKMKLLNGSEGDWKVGSSAYLPVVIGREVSDHVWN